MQITEKVRKKKLGNLKKTKKKQLAILVSFELS